MELIAESLEVQIILENIEKSATAIKTPLKLLNTSRLLNFALSISILSWKTLFSAPEALHFLAKIPQIEVNAVLTQDCGADTDKILFLSSLQTFIALMNN